MRASHDAAIGVRRIGEIALGDRWMGGLFMTCFSPPSPIAPDIEPCRF
jgi:hypothetical protein